MTKTELTKKGLAKSVQPYRSDEDIHRQTDTHTHTQTDRQAARDRQTDRKTDGRTDRRTDGRTDGQTLLKRCEDASKKEVGLRG